MCYSAMVNQEVKKLGLKFKARIDYALIEEMFERRLKDKSIKISKALEESFRIPENSHEKKIWSLISQYRNERTKELEAEMFKQKKRLADAERKLKEKETKKALEDLRISTTKIKTAVKKITDLSRKELKDSDSRIFPMGFAPIIIEEHGERVIKLARYHCRQAGKPASIDRQYDGLYNARKDSLGKYWKPLFGNKHAFFVVDSFYENVSKHDYEKRKLKTNEVAANIVLHFSPPQQMFVACLYDFWEAKGEDSFYSFAAITGEPTPEIAATGHERLIIALKPTNLDLWLNPKGASPEEILGLLEDPAQMHYEHELAG